MKKLLFLVLSSLICNSLISQQGFTEYTCTLANANAQFVNRSSFIIDNNGNKWTGFKRLNTSGRSLIKFDGTNWTDYTNIINAVVLALTADNAGNIWVGTQNAGLLKFDGTNVTPYTRAGSGLISDTIISLAFINNKIYAGSNKGFSEFDGTTFSNYSTSNSGLTNNTVSAFEKENAVIWLGTGNGLHQFSSGTISYTGLTDKINDIMIDAAGNKWLGTETTGLQKYNNSAFTNANSFLPTIIGAHIPSRVVSIGTSINGNPVIACEKNFNPDLHYPSYRKNSFIEVLSNNTYNFIPHSLYLNGDCLFAPPLGNELFFVDSKISTSSSGTLSPKKFLYSFNQTLYSPANALGSINSYNTQFLDINNISAGCNPNADIHWDGEKSLYEVPKGSGRNPVSRTSIWIGGYKNGTLSVAANVGRSNGMDYWPGTIDNITGLADSSNAVQFNKVWKINRFDIENFTYNFLMGNVQNGTYTIPQEILTWPGNDELGFELAPYVDFNNDFYYNPLDGDYPLIKGDQMLWWVYNDALANHTETGSIGKLKMQIQASAYAYTCPAISDTDKVINNTTFYNYKFIYKDTIPVDSFYVSVETEGDLGNWQDDYVGCDVMNQFFFYYNGDNYDEDNNGVLGYGNNLPYFSCNFLSGLRAIQDDGLDNDKDACIDCTDPFNSIDDDFLPESCLMSTFQTIESNSDPITGNPASTGNGIEFYNRMRGKWRTGAPMKYDGLRGTSTTGVTTKFLFPASSDPLGYCVGGGPGNPQPMPSWTEISAGFSSGDRRTITSSGKTNFLGGNTGEFMEFDFAYIFTQDSVELANGTLYQRMISDNQKVRNWFKNNNAPSCLDLSGIGLKENSTKIKLLVYPVPAQNLITIDAGDNNTIKEIQIIDISGRILYSHEINKSNSNIDIHQFAPGVYVLSAKTVNGMAYSKFVKQ